MELSGGALLGHIIVLFQHGDLTEFEGVSPNLFNRLRAFRRAKVLGKGFVGLWGCGLWACGFVGLSIFRKEVSKN